MSNRYPNRLVLGLFLAPLVAPLVVAVGSAASGFLPAPLREPLFPLFFMAVAASGWQGIPFFFYVVGTPISYVVTYVIYLRYFSTLERGEMPQRRSILRTSTLAGAITLGSGFALFDPAVLFSVTIVTPVFVGSLAGAVAGWVFCLIALRPIQPNEAAA